MGNGCSGCLLVGSGRSDICCHRTISGVSSDILEESDASLLRSAIDPGATPRAVKELSKAMRVSTGSRSECIYRVCSQRCLRGKNIFVTRHDHNILCMLDQTIVIILTLWKVVPVIRSRKANSSLVGRIGNSLVSSVFKILATHHVFRGLIYYLIMLGKFTLRDWGCA